MVVQGLPIIAIAFALGAGWHCHVDWACPTDAVHLNPLKIILTAGQVHDLAGADALVPGMEAEALLADKAYDADKRVIEPLEAAGKPVGFR